MRVARLALVVFLAVGLLVGGSIGGLLLEHAAPRLAAQALGAMYATGGTGGTGGLPNHNSIPIPPYLLSKNITTNTTTVVKTSAGVVGCVIINSPGGSSNTATIYGTNNSTYYGKLATIDTTVTGNPERCYGMIGSDGITVVTATGTAADLTITYR